ncbi:hypothetical protein HDU99_005266, partial [Rhizoclosmatium hyalinum]
HRLGDLEATRTSLYPPSLDPSCATAYTNTQQILLKNAATHYKRALDALGVPVNLLSTQRSCADEDAARGALFGMAKVLSHMDGREEDVRVALICWKRRSGVLGEDGEGCGIVFSERVLGLEWFEKNLPKMNNSAEPAAVPPLSIRVLADAEELRASLQATWNHTQSLRARLSSLDLVPLMKRFENTSLDLAFCATPVKKERLDSGRSKAIVLDESIVIELE